MPSQLWLTDRSRISDGLGFCRMARFLNCHFGPTGYGIQLKGTRIPLVRGTGLHDGLGHILEWCRDHDDLIQRGLAVPLAEGETILPVPSDVIREGVKLAQEKYLQSVAARGYAYLDAQEEVQYVIREQQYLIEGMIWAWCLEVLPEVLRRAQIVEVEHDDTYVLGCTCGLGDGILAKVDHESRDCQGIGLQCKPDFIAKIRVSNEHEYHEFKSTGADNTTFRDKWEVMIQMFAAILDTERRLSVQIGAIFVHGLVTGKREGDYNPDTGNYDGFTRQQSPYCYGYRRPAMPPMEPEDWKPSYKYWDDFEQKMKQVSTRGKNPYSKVGIWEFPADEGMTPGETWVRWIPSETRRKTLIVMGPFQRQELMVPEFLEETAAEENRWRAICWELYEVAQQLCTTHGEEYNFWADPVYQGALHRLVPKSYECRRYGMRHKCGYEDICFKREGWADPLGSGKYIPRRPHHKDELEQAIGRGLLPPDEGAGEEVGEVE